MLRFLSLGSGSSGNCYLLYTDSDALLIDIGVGTRMLKRRLREYGLSMDRVTAVLVTHDHADHVKSVGTVSKDYLLPVYTTREVHAGIDRNYCVRHKIAPDRMRLVEREMCFEVGSFKVTPFSVPHDSADNVGYRIEAEGVVFSVMTDVGHVTQRMKEVIGGTDYLVIEANYDEEMLTAGPYPEHLKTRIAGPLGHMSNRVCGVAIAENATERLRHVWLCHLSEENNDPELAFKVVSERLKRSGRVVGTDINLTVLRRTKTTGVFELK